MEIILNAQTKEVAPHLTIEALIQSLNLGIKIMACAVNMEIVKKQDWDNFTLNEGDRVDLLDFVGGG
ncbi:MAG: hypothetical protein KU28_04325 [Sulfurovum sp. PC08-66]|jgi:sulfur carrier protein|nr:MAG: hypothetical protein KU28_04325 [Sulfurovum sp. PC08-66]